MVRYEDHKRSHQDTHLQCQGQGINFFPMVVEAVGGGWGPTATKVLYNLAKIKSTITGETKNTVLNHLYQHLGILLHRENSRSILRRCAPILLDAMPILAAAAMLQCPHEPDT